ncbi:MAG: hypothetical protein IJG97_05430 [Bacilli bacterium]|nr:hypothetical protein [Bacilli bacterium]
MKKNKIKNKSVGIKLIIIVIGIIIAIITLFIMKAKYINMYNENKYNIIAQTKTIELSLAKEPKKYACMNQLCYSDEFEKIEVLNKDFVYDKNCDMYVKKSENTSNGCNGLVEKNYSNMDLISVNYLDKGLPSIYVYKLNDPDNMFEYTYNFLDELEKNNYRQAKKEYLKFIEKTDPSTINKSSKKVSYNFDKFWNFYANYKYNDVFITDSLAKIKSEYNKLTVYETFSMLISNDAPYYNSDISPRLPSTLEITRIVPGSNKIPSLDLQSIYIVKSRSHGLDKAKYRIFFGSYIFDGFSGWTDDEVLSFVQSIKIS